MARVTQNSKPTQSSSSTLSTHLFLEVPTLRSIPTKSQMLHCLIGLVVERVETNLPTSFFQVGIPPGKVTRGQPAINIHLFWSGPA